jgi:hypothetical protein
MLDHQLAGFYLSVNDIYFHAVHGERQTSGLYLNGLLMTNIQRYPDGTIELATQAPDAPEQRFHYHFHSYQFWDIFHDQEAPSKEYAGQLEAQLASILQTCNAQEEDQPRTYSIGATLECHETI